MEGQEQNGGRLIILSQRESRVTRTFLRSFFSASSFYLSWWLLSRFFMKSLLTNWYECLTYSNNLGMMNCGIKFSFYSTWWLNISIMLGKVLSHYFVIMTWKHTKVNNEIMSFKRIRCWYHKNIQIHFSVLLFLLCNSTFQKEIIVSETVICLPSIKLVYSFILCF